MDRALVARVLILICICTSVLVAMSHATTAWRDECGDLIDSSRFDSRSIRYVTNQLLVGLVEPLQSVGVDGNEDSIKRIQDVELQRMLMQYGAVRIHSIFADHMCPESRSSSSRVDLSRFFVVTFEADVDVPVVSETLNEVSSVLFAEPNYIIELPSNESPILGLPQPDKSIKSNPSDLDWSSQWNLHDTGPGIGCPTAWEITEGSPSIRIGNLEKQIWEGHYDLDVTDGRYYYRDLITGNPAAGPLSGTGGDTHSTKSAGIMCAISDNSRGVAGVAGGDGVNSGCSLVCIKVEPSVTLDVLAYATTHAADPDYLDCDVLSYSMGFDCYSETLRAAVSYAHSVGANVVASLGNDGVDSFRIPAHLDFGWVTAVGAYGPDGFCCIANDNCEITSNYGKPIDLLAPGYDYPSTSTFSNPTYVDTLLQGYGGTSGAAPHVAGAFGLLRSYFNNALRPEDYEYILKLTSRDEVDQGSDGDSLTWHERYGHGCLEIGHALETAAESEFLRFSVSGGTAYAYTDTLSDFKFISGPYMTGYKVIPYKVEASINFGSSFSSRPRVWGVLSHPFPYSSSGFSGANPNYCMPFSCVYDSTVTRYGCVAWTFVYKIHLSDGTFVSWYPESPGNAPIGCKALRPVQKEAANEREAGSVVQYMQRQSQLDSIRLLEESSVEIGIYDVRGRLVRRLVREANVTGIVQPYWDGRDSRGRQVGSGVYLVRYVINNKSETKKLVWIR